MAFHLAAKYDHVAAMEFLVAHGAYLNFKNYVRALLGTFMTDEEIKEGVRVQRCSRAFLERCTGTHEPPAQALRSPRRIQCAHHLLSARLLE